MTTQTIDNLLDTVICGDVFDKMPEIPTGTVHCVITSPPYWGLRDYGVDGQIGLEKTPEEYIAKMVAVFREVWRVLRDDGTLWLNLGDSYASGGRGGGQEGPAGEKQRSNQGALLGAKTPPPGLKPKDLCGIPWRVALALQQPYYTGTIKDERDRIWLAAMIDTEGCMFIHKRKVGQSNGQGYKRKNANYAPGLEIANTSQSIVDRCMAIVGKGSICSQSPEQNKRRKQTIYRWNLRTTECREIVREIYPYLTAKHHQARLLCGCPSSGPDADAAHQSLMALHNGSDATIDFPAPASMFEQGWYLRQDIIWKKPNPMPESVTDRCTKAHEYIFLLTKKPRYYCDMEAIREPLAEASVKRLNQDIEGQAGSTRVPGKTNGPMKAVCRGSFHDHTDDLQVGQRIKEKKNHPNGANKRSVWTVPTAPYKEAHFATFPPKLIEPCILAGTSGFGCCEICSMPWERVVKSVRVPTRNVVTSKTTGREQMEFGNRDPARHVTETKTIGWRPMCSCWDDEYRKYPRSGKYKRRRGQDLCHTWFSRVRKRPGKNDWPHKPAIVLDPFMGSGTVAAVSYENNRHYIGIDLNPDRKIQKRLTDVRDKYALFEPEIARARIQHEKDKMGLFAE